MIALLRRIAARVVLKVKVMRLRRMAPRVTIGRNMGIRGPFVVRGPGRVTVGDYVMFDTATGRPNRLQTFDPAAAVTIGNHCYLNGVELACARAVTIGDGAIIAECLMMDTDFHSVEPNRHEASAPVKAAPITIGRNVWIANKTILLRGVTIGDNSVVGAGSVVTRDVPPNVVVAGNPARVVRQLRPPGGEIV